jgi:hypothetical protein
MTKFTTIHNSFSTGEISDRLAGRTDLAKYFSSCRTMTNMLPTPVGFAVSRAGTKYLLNSASQTFTSRLIPFEATTDAFYLLEFTEDYFRILADDSPILYTEDFTNGDFTTNLTGWTQRNAGTSSVAQSTGKAVFTVVSSDAARIYQAFDDMSVNQFTVTCDVTGGNITYNVGTTIGGTDIATGTISGAAATFNFTPATIDSRIYIEFQTTTDAVTIDNIVLSDPEYRINHSYTESELQDIKYAQYNDLLYIVHPNHKPQILQRLSNTKWRFTPWDFALNTNVTLDFEEGPYLDTNNTDITITPNDTTGTITLTASGNLFSSTDVGRLIRYKGSISPDDDYVYTGTGAQTYFKIPFFPQTENDIDVIAYNANGGSIPITYENPLVTGSRYELSGPVGGYMYVHCPDPFSAGAATTSQSIEIKRKSSGSAKWGYAKITAYNSATSVTVTVLSDLSGVRATTDWQLGAFSDTTGYPSAVGFHDQRLIFGSTAAQPQTIWMSGTGRFGDFAPDSNLLETITDATSLNLTMTSSRVSKIRWFQSRGDLVIGTSGGVYSIKPSTAVGISPLSPPTLKLESSILCSDTLPSASENAVVFLDINKTKAYDLAYNLQNDGYIGNEMNLLADHLSSSTFHRVVFQNSPYPVFWILRDNGTLVSCLYLKQQDILGWAVHEIGGTDVVIKDIMTLRTNTSQDVYIVVDRTINGSTKSYIEKLTPEFRNMELKEACFVDSSLTLDQTETSLVLTLSSNTVGTGKTFTASGSKFVIGDIGKYIKNTTGAGYALITGYTSATSVTCNILTAFTSTSIAANSWAVSATTVSGLSHLEGETVSVWADGATLPNEVVTSGAITVDVPIFYAKIGLSFDRVIKSNRLDFPTKAGSVQGSIGRIHQLYIRLFETTALKVGTEDTNIVNTPFENSATISFRDTTTVLNSGNNLFSGDKVVLLPSDFSRDVNYLLKVTTPDPLTVVSVIAKCAIAVE